MRIETVQRRRRPLSLTSLIDVIFLLLLFFMLSSTFTRFAEVEISGGRASASAASAQPDILIRIDSETWKINGTSIGAEEAVAELTRLQKAGAETAVLLVRGEMTSQRMVEAVERIHRETTLTLSVAR